MSEARARVCLRAALLRRTRVLHGEYWRKEEAERKKGEREKVERVPPEAEGAYLTRRCALRESLPPTEVTLQVYVPMSPDQVWEMWRVPSGSSRMRGMDWTLTTEPSFSQTCLERKKYQSAGHIFI